MRTWEPPPLRSLEAQSFHLWLVVGVTCIGAFIGQLDASIVQLALPALKDAFDVSVDDVRWVAVAYLLAFAASLPMFGRICQIVGRKLLYLAGFALFSLASLLCGWTDDLGWLIAFRVVQGVGGGLLGANSIAILVTSVPPDKRPHAIGLFTTAQAIGVSSGPVIGGLLLDALGWRWIFWAVVPFGLAALLVGWLVLPRTPAREPDMRFDLPGAALLIPSLVLAVLAVNQASVWTLASPAMMLCLVAAAVFFVLFLRREKRTDWPLIDLGLFRRKAFAAGMLGVVLGYALLYGMFFLMSFALMHGLHNSAHVAGLKLAIIPIAIALIAPLGIACSERFTVRCTCVAAMAICIAAIAALAIIAFGPDRLVIRLCALALFGVGLGFFMAPNSDATIKASPGSQATTAGALVNLARVLGSCIGVSAASSVMSWQMQRKGVADLPGSSSPVSPALLDAVESSLILLGVFALIAAAASLARSQSATERTTGGAR